MNLARRQTALGQRRMTAALAAALSSPADGPVHRPDILRRGLARIDLNQGGGAYIVTELWWDGEAEEWTAASAPLGHCRAEALDYAKNTRGVQGQIVTFWEHRGLGGEVRLFLDAAGGWDGRQKVSCFTVHYSGNNTTGVIHSVPDCKNAFLEVGIDVRRCSAHIEPADHPASVAMGVTGGLAGLGWCNALATWSGGSWINLMYTARNVDGLVEGDGEEGIDGFHVQCRITAEGDLDLRVDNQTGGVVSAVIMAAVRITMCPPPPGSQELGDCCCHDDDWGEL